MWEHKIEPALCNSRYGTILELALFIGILAFFVTLSLPPTIIPFFVLAYLSIRIRRISWSQLGFVRPKHWPAALLAGLVIGGVIVAFTQIGLPWIYTAIGQEYQPAGLYRLENNLPEYLFLLVGTWVLAAFGEELVFRGYVLNRWLDLLGNKFPGKGIALVISAILFALGHAYADPLALALTFLHGLLLGSLYLVAGKNLWFSIIAHGTGITATLTLAFFGVF